MVAHSRLPSLSLFCLVAPAMVFGCGPTKSEDTGTKTETDTTSATTSTTSTSDPTPPPANTPSACDGPGDAYEEIVLADNCTTTAPPNCFINEFGDNFTCGSGECWGDETSLTGGAFTYADGANDSAIEYTKDDGGFLHITAENYSYTGFGMWFGPCTDASSWDGLELQISGELGETGQLVVQLQTDEDYPAESDKGSCAFESDDTKWSDCSNPSVALEGVNADSLMPFQLTWDQFSGGKPVDTVDPRQLRGVQLQFNCDNGDVPCNVDVKLMDLRWFKAE